MEQTYLDLLDRAGITLLGKCDDIMELLKKAIEAGYGELPAAWSIKLYLTRN